MFVSHETYTPARGGSASAEINALRRVFGPAADSVVIANTKGFTGHAMGAGIEEVVAIKALETGIVPPVANFREVDPELGPLNLSRGGAYPVSFALRLAAGFGSQIAMMLLRWIPSPDGRRRAPTDLGFAYRVADDATWQLLAGAGDRPTAGQARGRAAPAPRRRRRPGPRRPRRPPSPRYGPPSPPWPRSWLAHLPSTVPAPSPDGLVVDGLLAGGRVAAPRRQVWLLPSPLASAQRQPVACPGRLRPRPLHRRRRRAEPSATAAADPVEQAVLDIVEGLTGYSRDLLEPDLDLEADLGVDTVKQAEVFAAVRERFDIPRDENLRLRDFPTLAHVIGFVRDRAQLAELAGPRSPEPPRARCCGRRQRRPAAAASTLPRPAAGRRPRRPRQDAVVSQIVRIVSDMTGYPPELLDLDLDLEADLGVDTVKQAEVFAAVREQFGIPRDENLRLRDFPTLAHVIGFARDRGNLPQAAPAAAAPAAAPAPAAAQRPPPRRRRRPPRRPARGCRRAGRGSGGQPDRADRRDMTGYPPELLDLDLDLEADLGVDTVKQAEVFAAVREQFGIPRDENLRLRDFPTLAHVIGFARDRGNLPQAAPARRARCRASPQPRPAACRGTRAG